MLVCYESILTGESRAFLFRYHLRERCDDVMKIVRGQIAEVGTLAASPSRKPREVGHAASRHVGSRAHSFAKNARFRMGTRPEGYTRRRCGPTIWLRFSPDLPMSRSNAYQN
jgi:hypothetical protein